MNNDLTYEQEFIELLGYKIIETNNPNAWIIIDENDNKVGSIEYKQISKANKKRKYVPVYGYCTKLNTPTISFEYERKINDKHGNPIELNKGFYSFDIKRENLEPIHVDLLLTDNSSDIKIWGQEYGFMQFSVDENNGLFLNYKSNTENFNVEEIVTYKIKEEMSNYVYQINYCPKDIELTSTSGTSRAIEGIYSPLIHEKGKMGMRESTWQDGQITSYRESIVDGTIEDMLISHEMGIESLKHFRFLLKEILPFKEEIISRMVNNKLISKAHLSPFFKDSTRTKQKSLNNKSE